MTYAQVFSPALVVAENSNWIRGMDAIRPFTGAIRRGATPRKISPDDAGRFPYNRSSWASRDDRMRGGLGRAGWLVLGLLALLPARAGAADWPTRPIHWVVPFAAGGGNDIIARLMAPELGAALGQPIVIDNRPGAAGNLGSETVARAAPDGYTWLIVATPNAVNESLYRNLGFSISRDFAPVSLLMTMPNVLVVSNQLPAHSVAELIAYGTAHPGKLNFGSGGSGSTPHMAGELFMTMTGVHMVHVPYRGAAPALADLMAGQIQVLFDALTGSIEQIRAGNVRALAVTSPQRSASMPDLPTIAESGVPGYAATAWFGLVVPVLTDSAIVDRLNRVVAQALAKPELRRRINEMGADPTPCSPPEMAGFMRAEIAKWAKVIETSGVKVD
jgi:tripartite-type tricarboxylate transporter receptor subunit TctC